MLCSEHARETKRPLRAGTAACVRAGLQVERRFDPARASGLLGPTFRGQAGESVRTEAWSDSAATDPTTTGSAPRSISPGPVMADHRAATDFDAIPACWLERAKAVRVASHSWIAGRGGPSVPSPAARRTRHAGTRRAGPARPSDAFVRAQRQRPRLRRVVRCNARPPESNPRHRCRLVARRTPDRLERQGRRRGLTAARWVNPSACASAPGRAA